MERLAGGVILQIGLKMQQDLVVQPADFIGAHSPWQLADKAGVTAVIGERDAIRCGHYHRHSSSKD